MVTIPVPAFEPDKSRFNANTSRQTINCLPLADGWGPFPSAIAVTPIAGGAGTALAADCIGAIYARSSSGTERFFAFTATRIYEFNTTTYVWADVSGPAAPYAAASRWSIVQYGTYIVAQNGYDAEQYINIDGGVAFASNATAPVANYLAVVGDFLVRGNISGTPNQIQWSALNNFQSNTAGVDGSDIQTFPEGEQVMGIVPMTSGAVIAMRSAFYAMNFAPQAEWVFTFQLLTNRRGTSAPYSLIKINADDFVVYTDNGFVRGAGFQEIGAERVDAWFQSMADATGRGQMSAMVDPGRKIVWWRYKTIDQTYRLLGYDWSLDRWCQSDIQIAEMFSARTPAITIDGMDTLYSTVDDVDDYFDSLAFDSGTPQLAVVTSGGYLAFLNGSNQAATIEWNEVNLNGNRRAMINGARLVGDALSPTITLSTADYHGGTLTARSAATPSSRTKWISIRGDGRVHKISAVTAAADDWSIISGIDVDVVGTGR